MKLSEILKEINVLSAAASGDGLTPETAVKTLSEGYALLDKAAGGKLVLCGPVEGGGFDAADSAVTGPVTITNRSCRP